MAIVENSNGSAKKKEKYSLKKTNKSPQNSSLEDLRKKYRDEISQLSYDQSLNELDILLENLQLPNLPVEELQKLYLKGKIYLKHCEQLLDHVEQEVINIDDLD